VVKHDIRLSGRKTKARRQIDISIFETGKSQPSLIVEAKRHKRPIDAGIAGSVDAAGWGGLAAFFAHPALIALAISRCVQSGVAGLLRGHSARPCRDGRRPLVIPLRDGRHFSRHPPDRVEIPTALMVRLADALCYAA
jgi:hypothetical protein